MCGDERADGAPRRRALAARVVPAPWFRRRWTCIARFLHALFRPCASFPRAGPEPVPRYAPPDPNTVRQFFAFQSLFLRPTPAPCNVECRISHPGPMANDCVCGAPFGPVVTAVRDFRGPTPPECRTRSRAAFDRQKFKCRTWSRATGLTSKNLRVCPEQRLTAKKLLTEFDLPEKLRIVLDRQKKHTQLLPPMLTLQYNRSRVSDR